MDRKTIQALQDKKLLKGTFDIYYNIARTFKQELIQANGRKMEATTSTAEICCTSESTVHRAVEKMKDVI